MQADLSLRWAHMTEDTFSRAEAHLSFFILCMDMSVTLVHHMISKTRKRDLMSCANNKGSDQSTYSCCLIKVCPACRFFLQNIVIL